MTYAIYPSLKDRVVLITGGAGGIGAEHVMQFAAQGARVGFIDYNPEAAAAVVEKVRAAGHAAPDLLQVDLRDIAALEAAISGFIAKAGPVTVLVNNAAHDERQHADGGHLRLFRRTHRLQPQAHAVLRQGRGAGDEGGGWRQHRQFRLVLLAGGARRGCRSMSPPRPGSRG